MRKGFTLIELLVVISIISLLSSVVLSSLNSARKKGSDAAIKENLHNFQAQAALTEQDPYLRFTKGTNVCDASLFSITTPSVPDAYSQLAGAINPPNTFLSAILKASGVSSLTTANAGGPGIVICNRFNGLTSFGWVVQAPLTEPGAGFFCVDSEGVATTSPVNLVSSGSDFSCS